jgi:hypothetical protein
LDEGFRAMKAREAFDAYRQLYSQESCYRELLQFLRGSSAGKDGASAPLEEPMKSPRSSGAVVNRAAVG